MKLKETCPTCKDKKYKDADQCKKCQLKSNNKNKKDPSADTKSKKCIGCDKIIQNVSERCMDCYKKARKDEGIFEKQTNNTDAKNMKPCPDCNKLIANTSMRCRLCNYNILRLKSETNGKERIQNKCIDCSTTIVSRAIRCLPCSNKIVEKANTTLSNSCINCKTPICNSATRCVKCHKIKKRKVERPSYEQIIKDKETMTMLEIGKKYGVSNNTVTKWVKKYKKSIQTKET
jgi:ribosomal protein L40E